MSEGPNPGDPSHDEVLEAALGSIMSIDEYEVGAHEGWHFFELESGDRKLAYFGSRHIRDLSDPHFTEIKKVFRTLDPDLVIVEGFRVDGDRGIFNEKIARDSLENVVTSKGEAGFLVKLAVEHGVEWYCPEPSPRSEYEYLTEKGYSRDEIVAWKTLLILSSYARLSERTGFEEYLSPHLRSFRTETNWDDFDYSYAYAIKQCESVLGRAIDVETETEVDTHNLVDPIPWRDATYSRTVINEMSAASSELRDRTAVKNIAAAFNNHDRLLVLYGRGHARMQEPALRMLFESMQ